MSIKCFDYIEPFYKELGNGTLIDLCAGRTMWLNTSLILKGGPQWYDCHNIEQVLKVSLLEDGCMQMLPLPSSTNEMLTFQKQVREDLNYPRHSAPQWVFLKEEFHHQFKLILLWSGLKGKSSLPIHMFLPCVSTSICCEINQKKKKEGFSQINKPHDF